MLYPFNSSLVSVASQRDHTEATHSTWRCTSDLYAFLQTSLVDFRTFRVLVVFAAVGVPFKVGLDG